MENLLINKKEYIKFKDYEVKEDNITKGKVFVYTNGKLKQQVGVKALNIGFDTEYKDPYQTEDLSDFLLKDEENDIPDYILYRQRDIVSMQFFTKVKDLSVCIIIIMNEYERLKLETVLKEIIYCLRDLNVKIKDNFNPNLIAHFGVFDFSALRDCKNNIFVNNKYSIQQRGKKIYTLNGKGKGVDKFIKINPNAEKGKQNKIHLKDKETIKVYPRIKDTASIGTGGSLSKLGAALNIPKIIIKDKDLKDMRSFYNNDPKAFMEYAITDSVIAFEWVNLNFGLRIPTTIGTYSVNEAIKELCKQNNWYKDDKKTINKEEFYKYFSGKGIIDNNQIWKDAFNSAKYSYKGGYNQSFVHGIYFNKTYDLDISGAYPLAMSMLKDINWEKEPLKVKNTKATLKMFKPDEYGFGKAKIVYKDDVKFPATAKKEQREILPSRGLIFAREEKDYYTNPEIWYALKNGAYVYLEEYYFLSNKESNKMADLMHTLSIKRSRLKDNNVKYELQKLINNSLSGKMGQGLNDDKDIKESAFTNAYYAAHMTALVRVFLSTIMELISKTKIKETGNKRLIKKHTGIEIENKKVNGVVFGVTTDGIITNITNFDLNKLVKEKQDDEIIDLFLTSKKNLDDKLKIDLRERIKEELIKENSDEEKIKRLEREERHLYNIFEQKHQQDILINIKNRVNIGLNLDNSGQGVLAVSGYTIPGEVRKMEDESMNNFIAHMYLNRDMEDIKSFTKKYPSKRKFIQENRLDMVSEDEYKKVYWEYDFKGQPYNFKEVSFKLPVINSKGRTTVYKTYTICNYETKPWKDIKEFTEVRDFIDEKRPILKTKKDWQNFLFLYEGCYKNDVKITGTVEEVKAKQIVRLASKGILKPTEKKTGKDILKEVEDYYNVELNYNSDWSKGKKYSTVKDFSAIKEDINELGLVIG